MFIFHIYNNFETEGHCRDQEDFYLLKTIISFNSGKIKMKKLVYLLLNHHEQPVFPNRRCRNVFA